MSQNRPRWRELTQTTYDNKVTTHLRSGTRDSRSDLVIDRYTSKATEEMRSRRYWPGLDGSVSKPKYLNNRLDS